MNEYDERGERSTASSEDDVLLYRRPDGTIAIKATTWNGEPVELTVRQARELAVLLLKMAAGQNP